jgi:transposase
MSQVSVLGIDLAKQVFHVVGMHDTGTIVWRQRLTRSALRPFIARMPPVVIGMEACGGAHYWARRCREPGPVVTLMAPQFVKPYLKSNTHERAEADAIAEAVTRPTMRFVPVKELAQQDVQALHRVRERWVQARTALIKEIRGWLSEYGIVLPQGVTKVRQGLLPLLEQAQGKLTARGRARFEPLYAAWLALEERLAYDNAQLETMCQSQPVCQRLRTIPGLGPLTATALGAAVNDATPVKNGRQFAAWLGLGPRQHSPGGKPPLLGISTRGERDRRKLLVHGARATLRWTKLQHDRSSQWVRALLARRGTHRAMVALATNNARIVWGRLTTDPVDTPESRGA